MNEFLAWQRLDDNMGKLLFHEICEDLLLAGDKGCKYDRNAHSQSYCQHRENGLSSSRDNVLDGNGQS
jgi:hypothetical protein